jgi:hypothetical protein
MPEAFKQFLPVETDVEGTKVILKPLSNYDRMQLIEARNKFLRANLICSLDDSGIPKGVDYFATLRRFDQTCEEMTVNAAWVDYCNSTTDYDVILVSIKKTVPDAAEAERLAKLVQITFEEKAQVCALGLKEPEPENKDKKGEGDGDDQHPPSYGAADPMTGTPTVTTPTSD